MTHPTKHQEIRPCRWCGHAPGIEQPESNDETETVAIVCANGNCTVMPCVGAMGMDYAIETWNRGAGI